MKTNAIVRIVIWSIVLVVLLGILVLFIRYDGLKTTYSSTVTVSDDAVYPVVTGETASVDASQVHKISIEWVAGDILLQPGDVDTIEFSESEPTDERYAMVWKQSGNKLSIQFCKETISGFGITIGTDLSKDLVITVPQDWVCTELEIDAASANVIVRDLTIREVDFDGASGTCEFENCHVDSLEMDTASGDISFYGTLDTLDIDGASACICATLTNIPSRIDVDTMSGDLELTLPENAGFTVSMSTLSSDFYSDFETTSKNGSYVHGDGACRINVDAMSGDVTIHKCADSTTHHAHDENCYAEDSTCPDYGHH